MGFNSGSSSSEEIGDQAEDQKAVNENAVPASRFYECTYCKRGFTNAQALGGHMNIHRKEKARAKQQKSANKRRQSSKSYEDLANCGTSTSSHLRYYEHDQQQIQNYEVPVGDQQMMIGNYSYQHHYFFPAPGSNPSHDCVAPGNENPHLLFDQDPVDLVHVNRDVGETGNGTNKTWDQESEVDLELRLGLTQ